MEKNIHYSTPDLSVLTVKAGQALLQGSLNSGTGNATGKDMTVYTDEDW